MFDKIKKLANALVIMTSFINLYIQSSHPVRVSIVRFLFLPCLLQVPSPCHAKCHTACKWTRNGASENHSPKGDLFFQRKEKTETANLARIFPLDAIGRLAVAWPWTGRVSFWNLIFHSLCSLRRWRNLASVYISWLSYFHLPLRRKPVVSPTSRFAYGRFANVSGQFANV